MAKRIVGVDTDNFLLPKAVVDASVSYIVEDGESNTRALLNSLFGEAGQVAVADAGDHFSGSTVEAVLQELGEGAGTAAAVTVVDAESNYVGTDVEAILEEVSERIDGKLDRAGGGGGLVNTLSAVTGATVLDLANGNRQVISSTAGNYTLSVANAGQGEMSFRLSITTTTDGHEPTWPVGSEFPIGIEDIQWLAGVTEEFLVESTDGGVTLTIWHMTPQPPVSAAIATVAGEAAVGSIPIRFYNPFDVEVDIVGVFASAGVAPTGADLIADVNLDGVTIFTTQGNRPTVAAAAYVGSETVPDVTTWPVGHYLTVDIDQVGSTVAGSGVMVYVKCRRSAL